MCLGVGVVGVMGESRAPGVGVSVGVGDTGVVASSSGGAGKSSGGGGILASPFMGGGGGRSSSIPSCSLISGMGGGGGRLPVSVSGGGVGLNVGGGADKVLEAELALDSSIFFWRSISIWQRSPSRASRSTSWSSTEVKRQEKQRKRKLLALDVK